MNLKRYGITVEKRIHRGWQDWQKLKQIEKSVIDSHRPMGHFHKWQYTFSSEKGTISLIKLFDYYRIGEHVWEIYCTDDMQEFINGMGDEAGFIPTTPAKKELTDIERFKSREDAIKRIIEILR